MVKEFKASYTVVYIKSHEAAIDLNFNILNEDISGGTIMFRVGVSATSWGEKFKINITSIEENLTKVEVTSESAFLIQLIDWGKNKENIEEFFKKLTHLL